MVKKALVILITLFLFSSIKIYCLMIEFSDEELTLASQNIITGTVLKKESYWDDTHSKIYTKVTVMPDQVLKGSTSLEPVDVVLLGGVVGAKKLVVEDMPDFAVDEDVMLFLGENSLGQMACIGAFQGKRQLSKKNAYLYSNESQNLILKVKKIINAQKAK